MDNRINSFQNIYFSILRALHFHCTSTLFVLPLRAYLPRRVAYVSLFLCLRVRDDDACGWARALFCAGVRRRAHGGASWAHTFTLFVLRARITRLCAQNDARAVRAGVVALVQTSISAVYRWRRARVRVGHLPRRRLYRRILQK